ncbi:MAG: inositol monophosphatase [Ferrovum sp. 37-45-19]|uniref:inositol monophosphatase family protein n=1 Tax=Ferrovum sp. JA12 TaxID=1356299 RepID=UPI0007034F21|nr:inositol monophosphatase family protein [Ferrovum sp. JA12]OYV79340.1 MAG: inositol monophosphatase [Ferrovum sp. 21-44-67]OYV94020.1 MAG: inositol monophosphatase [Ferrovum sp. 37-45-19]HQT81857.1 inositol monophosphatase family protein [Ferrovaceae bacterium]KRH79342.1 fructose-1,6-bisphosphatase/inositol-1-monophosphatase [Ferrovum sp. JA12]HQU06810.1 inositol monophosphatase family protein [Ferrovaceae bacterium]
MRKPLITLVKSIALEEVVPRYRQVKHHRKEDGSLCTEADLMTQSSLSLALLTLKNCPILGEEMSTEEQQSVWQSTPEYLWCIDPIDGTTNFTHGIDYFALSVALLHHGLPILGVVYNPITEEVFSAEKGGGAFLNEQKIVNECSFKALDEAIASVDFKRLPWPLAERLSVSPPYSSQRNFGACALEWCHVAVGKFDVYLHGGQKLWDYAAGSLILQEAGGIFTTLDHQTFWNITNPWKRSVIAAKNPLLFDQWRTWLNDFNQPK